ncbi:hypothetical protein [Desulfogranum japonicum]|uniref:hypothetical protein n=1 Tax=Desulfogranum japonicum TaxID=231447 RepID=UPI000418C896|nr:hypothetical protein [Desulfogranum japonicum]
MNSCLGITQHVEIAEEYIERTFERHKELVFVGPFKTSIEATQWLKYMLAHSHNGKKISLPGYFLDTSPWYGVAFLCEKKKDNYFPMLQELSGLSSYTT